MHLEREMVPTRILPRWLFLHGPDDGDDDESDEDGDEGEGL